MTCQFCIFFPKKIIINLNLHPCPFHLITKTWTKSCFKLVMLDKETDCTVRCISHDRKSMQCHHCLKQYENKSLMFWEQDCHRTHTDRLIMGWHWHNICFCFHYRWSVNGLRWCHLSYFLHIWYCHNADDYYQMIQYFLMVLIKEKFTKTKCSSGLGQVDQLEEKNVWLSRVIPLKFNCQLNLSWILGLWIEFGTLKIKMTLKGG